MADAIIKLMDEVISDSLQDGIVHHFTEDQHLNGACFTINAQNMTNFASCSYLGLEQHPDLVQGTIQAVQQYGTQFSSSRTFVSLGLSGSAENLAVQGEDE